ncbi:MAG: trypsin-like peptidase domain-containing protein [Caldilinea sp.]|nr:trypsin-like peptidase domain-containing protein [Caldilinea sp.]MDW8440777.1 trypsin-like peptidase domain-containing protein [Caldilineaceae bacterium]
MTGCTGQTPFRLVTEALRIAPPNSESSVELTSVPQSAPKDLTETLLIDAAGLDFFERRIVRVYEEVAPAVVSITTRTLRRDFFFNVIPQEGAGSGFVIDREGHILTNYHVIQGVEFIEVSFGEQVVAPAAVVGIDPRNDVAVLKVNVDPDLLHPVTLGSSHDLRVGQWAIAIGNPFGQFGRTLTTGVISALDRTLEGPDNRTITGVIQTDAAINKGNSGGPLLDSSGRVIGITSAIFSPTGTSAGVGFAVPVDTLKRILPDLLTLGYYRRPWLGIRYAYNITPGLAEALRLPTQQGLLLVQLYEGSPLAIAGVRGAQRQQIIGGQLVFTGGDILLAVDDQQVASVSDLDNLLENRYHVDDVVTLTILRDGRRLEVKATLVEEPR